MSRCPIKQKIFALFQVCDSEVHLACSSKHILELMFNNWPKGNLQRTKFTGHDVKVEGNSQNKKRWIKKRKGVTGERI